MGPCFLQRAQYQPNSGIDPVFKQADRVVPLPVDPLRFPGLFLRHADHMLKGMDQRRADKLQQRLFVRNRVSHPFQRVPGAFCYSFFRLGQRPVQVEQNPFRLSFNTDDVLHLADLRVQGFHHLLHSFFRCFVGNDNQRCLTARSGIFLQHRGNRNACPGQ